MEEKMRKEKQKGRTVEKPEESDLAAYNEDDSTEKAGSVDETNDLPVPSSDDLTVPYVPSETATKRTAISEIPDQLPPVPQTQVESERLEVIEIKTDGHSGHLSPLSNFDSE